MTIKLEVKKRKKNSKRFSFKIANKNEIKAKKKNNNNCKLNCKLINN